MYRKKYFKVLLNISVGLNLLFCAMIGYKIYNSIYKYPRRNVSEESYWKDKKSQYQLLNQHHSGGMFFVGDSLIDRCEFHEFISLENMKIYNRGNAWEDTASLLERIENTVINGNPEIVVLSIGSNDIKYEIPKDVTIKNLFEIIHRLKEKHIRVFIVSILPVWEGNIRNNAIIRELNESIKHLCGLEDVRYLDIYRYFINSKGTLKKGLSNDGVHLNGDGYHVYTKHIRSIIIDSYYKLSQNNLLAQTLRCRPILILEILYVCGLNWPPPRF